MDMYEALIQQDNLIAQRRALAKTITLLESTRADHREAGDVCSAESRVGRRLLQGSGEERVRRLRRR